MRPFRYDIVKLIESVKDRPCLWDKTKDNYKDRLERRTAWEEIFNLLDDTYAHMTPTEKRETGEHILSKWQNTRDTFIRSLKIAQNGKPKRKYLFYEQLKFLTKVVPENCIKYLSDESESKTGRKSFEEEYNTYNDEDSKPFEGYEHNAVEQSHDFDDSSENEVFLPVTKKMKKENSNQSRTNNLYSNDINFIEVDETNNPRLMNEDEAFFASLLPTVVKYNEDERLEFRLQVLNVMSKIREKQRNNE